MKVAGYSSNIQLDRGCFEIQIFEDKDMVLVGSECIPQNLGPSSEQITTSYTKASESFKGMMDNSSGDGLSLNCTNVERDKCLETLKEIGEEIRSNLFDSVEQAFKKIGLFSQLTTNPFLTFTQRRTKDTQIPLPVLWELLYDGEPEQPVTWEKFWGFSRPITRGISRNRPPQISIKRSFSAINEGLRFATEELNIFEKLPEHKHFAAILRDEVEHYKVKHSMSGSNSDEQEWLNYFYESMLCATNETDSYTKESTFGQWTQKIFGNILTETPCYDLFHFACHCSRRDRNSSEWWTKLEMKVGGKEIKLSVGTISNMKKNPTEGRKPVETPGSLVFLNACSALGVSSIKTTPQPPGFPKAWIESQGAVAVIGPIFDIPDHFACAFSCKFYEILFSAIDKHNKAKNNPSTSSEKPEPEQFLAEALLGTRRYFMEKYNNPLGLGYILYAPEKAYVTIDFPKQGA